MSATFLSDGFATIFTPVVAATAIVFALWLWYRVSLIKVSRFGDGRAMAGLAGRHWAPRPGIGMGHGTRAGRGPCAARPLRQLA